MPFETGVVVFFRVLGPDNNLARSVHPEGRAIVMNDARNAYDAHSEDYVIVDENDKTLGIYPRDWVACILPLQTIGPADVTDQPARRDSSSSSEERDTKSFLRGTKRLDPRQ